MSDWMRRLAAHYAQVRRECPDEDLLIVFDIDGTILDMRYMVRHVLLEFDRAHGTEYFRGLEAPDVTVHENQVARLLDDRILPPAVRRQVMDWYVNRRWRPEAVLAAHRPYRGVLDVIRWFQIQPRTSVGLNTGRPESLRLETLRSLNSLGEEYRVAFRSELLHMNPRGWEQGVAAAKLAGLRAFEAAGYRVFAVVDNEPANIAAMAQADAGGQVLFLHAQTLYESARTTTPRTVEGRDYDITELVSERDLPQHVQLVWHGLNDEWNLRQFLASPVLWGECDVRVDPVGQLVLRHDSFAETPWTAHEELMPLEALLDTLRKNGRGVKLDLKHGRERLEDVLAVVDERGPGGANLWFNATVEALEEEGFRRVARGYPDSVIQCPVDFLGPLVIGAPARAQELLAMLGDWGVNRFSVSWGNPHARVLLDRLEAWGHDVNIYAVPDLEAFLRAALLLPRSLTADFNFPQWHYFGRGSGERRGYHRYQLETTPNPNVA